MKRSGTVALGALLAMACVHAAQAEVKGNAARVQAFRAQHDAMRQGSSSKLSGALIRLQAAQAAAAKQRAEAAGRRYPNLVDNLWAARLPRD